MRSKIKFLLGWFLTGLFLAGCQSTSKWGVDVSSILTENDTVHIKQKISAALGRDDLVKSMQVVPSSPTDRRLLITLFSGSVGADESVCLKAMRALSRDPLIPKVESIIIVTCKQYVHWIPIGGGNTSITKWTNVEEGDPIFKCGLSREALLRGDEPEVWMRNGRFVSEPKAGQTTNPMPLHEK
jgi:hypothetical protein